MVAVIKQENKSVLSMKEVVVEFESTQRQVEL